MSLRVLSSGLQKKAEEELNEVPSRIPDDLKQIREWLSKQPHLKARTDDQWLINFLRGCKFSVQRTKEKLDMFYTVRTLVPEFFKNRDPFLPEIQDVLERGIVVVCPKTVDSVGPVITITRFDKTDPEKVSLDTIIKVSLMILDILFLENDNCAIAGQLSAINMQKYSYKYMSVVTPNYANKLFLCLQNAYPTRFKGINFLNAPSFFVNFWKLVQVFLNDKLKNRIRFCNDSNLHTIYKDIPLSVLPVDLGGQGDSCDELTAQWKLKVESYRDWFLEDAQYCSDESKRPKKAKTSDELLGLDGSFRKLDID